MRRNPEVSSYREKTIPLNYTFVVLAWILTLFVPANEKYLLVFGFVLISMCAFGIKMPCINMNLGVFLYILIYVGAYLIHYYSESFKMIFVFLCSYFCVRYLVLVGINTRERFESFLEMVSISAIPYALLCIVETFTSFNIFDTIFGRTVSTGGANSMRFGLMRAHGVCTISINNGLLLVFLLCICSYMLFNNITERRKLLLSSYIILLLSVILNLSRMVILLAVAIQCVMAVKCGFGWVIKRILIIAGILLILAVPILSRYISSILNFIQSMFLALFNSDYVNSTTGAGGIGDRISLWKWVYDAVKDHLALGMGFVEQFSVEVEHTSGVYTYTTTKTSIEVHWLSTLYHRGLLGLFGVIVYQLSCLRYCFRGRDTGMDETHFSFNFLMLVVAIGYFAGLFTVTGSSDMIMFYFLFSLCESYNKILSKEAEVAIEYERYLRGGAYID